MPAAGWLRVQLGQPGVLLLRRLCPWRPDTILLATETFPLAPTKLV
jgi:hypothetical protein